MNKKNMSREKIKHHIAHLREKHDELDKRITLDQDAEYIIRVLKKEKLELKDEIERFQEMMDDL